MTLVLLERALILKGNFSPLKMNILNKRALLILVSKSITNINVDGHPTTLSLGEAITHNNGQLHLAKREIRRLQSENKTQNCQNVFFLLKIKRHLIDQAQ